jgi:hypothetical protein
VRATTVLRWFLAYFRLNKRIVCELSVGRGEFDDFHDYPDSTTPVPWHFHRHRCVRCGKRFQI